MIQVEKNLNIVFFLVFIVLSLFCYSNVLNNAFILDDDFLITSNLYIQDWSLVPKLFKVDIFHFKIPDLTASNLYYRPLQSLSYAFDYSFFKFNTWGYHLINILLHGLNSFVLFLLLGLIFKDKILAFLTGVFFCVHPIQVSVVAYITGRGSILEAFFILSSLWFSAKYFLEGKKVYRISSLLLFILALLSREGAILLPFFTVLCAFFLKIDRKKIFVYTLPFWLIAAVYIVGRMFFLPCSKCTFLNLFSVFKIKDFILLSQNYLSQLILPAGLRNLFFGQAVFIKPVLIFSAWLITLACLAGAFIFKNKPLIFGLLFYFLGLLPTLNLIDHINYYGVILCEHYLYLAAIGGFLILANLVIFLEKKSGMIAKFFIGALFLFYFFLTLVNNNYYKDPITFYRQVLSVDKDHSFVRVNLGNAYLQKYMFDQAIQEGQAVLQAEPGAWDAYLLLGHAYKGKGEFDQAVKFYRQAIQLNPVGIQGYLNLGITLAETEDAVSAEGVFKEALARFPNSVDLHRNLGVLYGNTGKLKEAIRVWQEGLLLNPADQGLKDNINDAEELLKDGNLK
ncbi:MAG TPA: tetratricopeptide repeat protein [Candidatus Omnitrophota bacterium]|nr:tetratricopeptide repeat protein [Candidatus Omnitrophota bacterium]HPT39459.1 tetratricopeptide repeat protein [Candidatus Omnitrophota bacterium]